ncbi:hypothetical protein HELRODRAFT_76552, partial [Helobdella robusta]|uniref:non-specific serine/threonine protein kinase n=1 Tax=Helobdella robusta TaxID=6412 RepID=T1G2L4_HELRO
LGKRIGLYRVIKDIGKGNFSQVKLGIHSMTKDKVAIKIIDRAKLTEKTKRFLTREINCMNSVDHQNILKLFQVVETVSKIGLIVEFAPGGDLYTKITDEGRLPESLCRRYFRQMVSAVQHMHARGVIHRDLKAENILFSSSSSSAYNSSNDEEQKNVLKIGDFGFSIHLSHPDLLDTYCGSPPYAAPELFKDDFYRGELVDVWALGVLLYFMATAALPFQSETIKKLKELILECSFVVPKFVTNGCYRLIKNILVADPVKRLKVDEVLADEWLAG